MLLFKPDWKLLESLRKHFLTEKFSPVSYWKNREILEQYDRTFGERISWKWDSVLNELKNQILFHEPESITLIDWGCGTGVASRKFLEHYGTLFIKRLVLLDHSSLAVQFAKETVSKSHPNLPIETSLPKATEGKSILLISHVFNELSNEAEEELIATIKKMDLVIWVEPGTPALSQRLIELRENLKTDFKVVAPCPHQETCGLRKLKESPHWCHFFAVPPSSIFQDSFWSEFSLRLKIDLRALPTSFLILAKPNLFISAPKKQRLLGRARHYKGYSVALICSKVGVEEKKFLKKQSKEVIEIMKQNSLTIWVP